MPDHRPVWLTCEQRDALADLNTIYLNRIVRAWDAAPADPTEAVALAIDASMNAQNAWQTRELDKAVLRALGAPDA